jgi:hypothetical protein
MGRGRWNSHCRQDIRLGWGNRMRRWMYVVVLALGGCSSPAPAPAPNAAALTVSSAGFAATPSGFSVGVALRNTRFDDAEGIEITVEFLHVSGSVLGRATERLPYCPAETECLWGSTFTRDVAEAGTVSAVRAKAVASGWEPASRRASFVLAARRPDGSVSGRAPPTGVVYVVSLLGGVPRAGAFRRTTPEEEFVVPADLLPPAGGEVIRAVFYDEPAPVGD